MPYEATKESLNAHPLPAWFQDAKLGIFVHWGLYSVPGWATPSGELSKVVPEHGWEYWFRHNPYAEWYHNSLLIPGSPTQEYHQRMFGADFKYEDFAPLFQKGIEKWDPGMWAGLFQEAGARYVVLTSKHHDGYLLWPSKHENPHRPGFLSRRDLVGELTQAVRGRGMEMGLYYSGGLDWSFLPGPIRTAIDLMNGIPRSGEFIHYVDTHWRELIDRYHPAVLWGDIGYPHKAPLAELMAYYYNQLPDGVVNDRFSQIDFGDPGSLRNRLISAVLKPLLPILANPAKPAIMKAGLHADFRTPEYTSYAHATAFKWESTRGLGYSFGFNRNEDESHLLTAKALVRALVDIVSKNGNLLLNVGPMFDGTIPEGQRTRLVALGEWLRINGEAIYGTRPWVVAEGKASQVSVRFTSKAGGVYAILLDTPAVQHIHLENVRVKPGSLVTLLGEAPVLEWTQEEHYLIVTLPEDLEYSMAHTLKISPKPEWVGRQG
jgi:alpha-L-fucosidase